MDDKYGAIPIFYQALSEAYTGEVGFFNTIRGLIIAMLCAVARTMETNMSGDYSAPVKIKKNEHRLLQIEKFVDDNIYSPICARILPAIHLSSRQVGRIIQMYNGMTTKQFIIKKMEKAKQLLRTMN